MTIRNLSSVYIWGWISKFSQLAAGLLIVPLIISNLGVNRYSEYTYLISIFLFMAYLDLNIPTSLMKIISKYNNNSFHKYQHIVISTAKSTLIFNGLVVFAILFILIYLRLIESGNDLTDKLLSMLAILLYCASFPLRIAGPLLQASGKIVQTDKVMSLISIIKVVMIFITTRFAHIGLELWLVIFALGEYLTHFLQYIFYKSNNVKTDSQIFEFSSRHRNYLIKFGFLITVISLINFLILNSPLWVLHSLKNYEVYVSAYSLVLLISVNFFSLISRYQVLSIPKSITNLESNRKDVYLGALKYLIFALCVSYIFYVCVLLFGFLGILNHWLKSPVIADATLYLFSIIFPGYIFYQITSLFRNVIVMNIGRFGIIKLLAGFYTVILFFLYMMPSISLKFAGFGFILFVISLFSIFNSRRYGSKVSTHKYYVYIICIFLLFTFTYFLMNFFPKSALIHL